MEKDKENKLNEDFRKYIDQKEQGIEMKEKIGLKVIKSKESNHTNLNGKQEENRIKEARKQGIKIGTWNLQGLNEAGAAKNLLQEIKLYKLDILAVQETHLKEVNIQELEGYVFYNSGGKHRRFGTGFLVKENLVEKIKKFEAVSEKLCYLTIQTENKKLTIINIHAPTEEKKEEEKEMFYEELERVVNIIPKNNIKMVIGDANAKVGKEDIYRWVVGTESKHQVSNDNGLRLISFAAEMKMKIMSTHFARKDIYKGTWIIPGRNETNQIDHVLIQEQYAYLIKNVRTYRGADINSDHFLVGVKLREIKIDRKQNRKKVEAKYNMEDLKNETIARKYRQEIIHRNSNMEIGEGNDIDSKWEKIENAIKVATRKHLSKHARRSGKEWLDQDCRKEIEKRKILRHKLLQSGKEADKINYQEQRRKTKKLCREKKRAATENKIKAIEGKYKNKEIRNFYRDVKEMRKGYQARTVHYKNKEGNLISNEEEVVERWKEYFDELLNEGAEGMEEGSQQDEIETLKEEIEQPTKEEIYNIIETLKNNKSPGHNGITAENIKAGGKLLKEKIYELMGDIYTQEAMPQAWNKATIVPLYKKGDKSNCHNYRGIALLDVAYKVLSTWIKQKIEVIAEKLIGEYQAGFRKGRSTTDQVFTLKQTLTACYEYEIPIHLLFVDFKKAYDSVKRKEVITSMQKMKIPEKLIRLTKMTLQKTMNVVKVNGRISDAFEVGTGLRQGDPLSALLFNIILEDTIRDSGINRNGTIFTKSHQCLAYADDIVLFSRGKKELIDVTRKLIVAAKKKGLYINEDKSNYMQLRVIHGRREEELQVKINDEEGLIFKKVDSSMYLGTLIDDKCNEETEIELRMMRSNRCASGLHSILRSKEVSKKTKIRVYKSVLRPTLLYGSETWVMNKRTQTKIEAWERKILRRIYGGKRTEEGWERRTNAEVYGLFSEPIISDVVRSRRLQWAGHLERMESERLVKTIAWREPEGKRRRGRPRRKWREAMEEDIREKQIENWRRKAADRKKWKEVTQLWA